MSPCTPEWCGRVPLRVVPLPWPCASGSCDRRGGGQRGGRVLSGAAPSLAFERAAWDAGCDTVVGVDEVGRGAWAGPLMVGAAILPRDRRVYGVRDSKMLPEAIRERLYDRIARWCRTWAVGAASQVECDSLGMAEAQRLAARRAIAGPGRGPRPGADRRELGLRRLGLQPTNRTGGREVPVHRRGVHLGQGDPRPPDACVVGTLPRVRFRQQQGVSVPSPSDGAAGVRSYIHPSTHLGVHGPPALGHANREAWALGRRRA